MFTCFCCSRPFIVYTCFIFSQLWCQGPMFEAGQDDVVVVDEPPAAAAAVPVAPVAEAFMEFDGIFMGFNRI